MAAKVAISARYCKGCGLCITACPQRSLRFTGDISETGCPVVEPVPDAKCTGCVLCAAMCPDAAITIEVEEEDAETLRR
jgi:2-oxoglutarate ferredoxin oxidoreductase subunit delta